ncbi:MAG: signal recognition particle-docking protein FtsY [Alphaproteobacteria bacterium]|nr:signal recognition particle-docking protein FtsY [Alphaproteobacteria bacterium]OJV14232.1 MAG: signal recognition particle-docking protein FtsY [Alphaproteobacteria bacterium 33-17]
MSDNEQKLSWFAKIKSGLKSTTSKFGKQITSIFTAKKIDNESLEDLETLLISSDIGTEISFSITEGLRKKKFDGDNVSEEVRNYIYEKLESLMSNSEKTLEFKTSPSVIIMCGVNGNGKTTTSAKLAKIYQNQGLKVLVVACDTFRAAAVEQIKSWCNKLNVDIYIGKENQDPASVAFEAAEKVKAENYDLLIIDTAGRLQNKLNLMDELSKIARVVDKVLPNVPTENIIVIDGTTGQNAIKQVASFKEYIKISGIIVTKLDGTAKGGIVISITDQFKLPIIAIGVGEKEDDLVFFNKESFLKAIIYGSE